VRRVEGFIFLPCLMSRKVLVAVTVEEVEVEVHPLTILQQLLPMTVVLKKRLFTSLHCLMSLSGLRFITMWMWGVMSVGMLRGVGITLLNPGWKSGVMDELGRIWGLLLRFLMLIMVLPRLVFSFTSFRVLVDKDFYRVQSHFIFLAMSFQIHFF
jgi:hypothetical protein